MGEQEVERETAGVGEHESWWQRALSWGGLGHTGVEALHAAQTPGSTLAETTGHFAHHAAEAGGTGLANWLGPLALASGINEMVNGHTGMDKVAGGLEAVSGGIGTTGLLGAGLSAAGDSLAVAGLGGEIGAASTLGMEAGIGLSSAGGALTGAAAAAAPVAAVAGAGAAGIGIGRMFDNDWERRGWGGKNADGTNRSFTDMSADHAVAADEWVHGGVQGLIGGQRGSTQAAIGSAVGSGLGTAAGVGTVLGESILGTVGAIANVPFHIGESIGSGISSLFGS